LWLFVQLGNFCYLFFSIYIYTIKNEFFWWLTTLLSSTIWIIGNPNHAMFFEGILGIIGNQITLWFFKGFWRIIGNQITLCFGKGYKQCSIFLRYFWNNW
jgi:hypothetical protein